ncbi:ATPase [Nocardiopsis sp. MG754419]|nr:ATPase [Nocardiopsis sp. MG754419]
MHGDPWPRRLGRTIVTPFLPTMEVADTLEVRRRLQRSTATGRRILVDDFGTGADTAVVTALIARVLAHHRRDRVLAVDATDRRPLLGTRLDAHAAYALGEGVEIGGFEQAAQSLGEASPGLWTVQAAQRNEDAYAAGLLPLFRFFGVTLVAVGAGGAFVDAVADTAHARVRVVRATRDAARLVGRGLDRLIREGRRPEVESSVIVVFDEDRHEDPGFDAARVTRIIAESGAEVVRLRYDRHLAQGRALQMRRVAAATHRTALHIAAEAMTRAVEAAGPRYAGTGGRGERT